METKSPLLPSDMDGTEHGKDKKTASKKKPTYIRVPGFESRPPKPIERKPLDYIFSRDELPKTEKQTKANVDEDASNKLKQPNQATEEGNESDAFDVDNLPTADEILAKLRQDPEIYDDQPQPEQAERQEKFDVGAELSLEEGEAELPLEAVDADELHQRLQLGTQKLQAETPNQRSQVFEESSVEPTQTPSSAPEAGAGQGGGNHEPPQPPHAGGEHVPDPEEPERSASHTIKETEPTPANRAWQTPDTIARQFGQEVHPGSAPLSVDRLTQHETVVQRPEHAGLLAALVVGVVDWHGRHKLRKELRQGQTKQNRQLSQTHHALQETQAQQQAQRTEHLSTTQRLRASIEELASRLRRSEAKPQLAPQYNRPPAAIERQDTLPLAAMAAAAAERQAQLPENHQIKSSAWHSYEVDKKTGRVVENPSFVYGREFKHEQSHEKWREDTPALAAGQLAMLGSSASPAEQGRSITSTAHTPTNPHETTIHDSQISIPIVGNAQKSWLWGGLVVVVFIIISTLILS